MYPVQRSACNLTGDAALLDDEGTDKLLLDSRTARRPGRATVTRRKLCAEAFCGHFAAPRDFTSSVEQYVNLLCHLLTQLALQVPILESLRP